MLKRKKQQLVSWSCRYTRGDLSGLAEQKNKPIEKWHLICRNKYTHTQSRKGRPCPCFSPFARFPVSHCRDAAADLAVGLPAAQPCPAAGGSEPQGSSPSTQKMFPARLVCNEEHPNRASLFPTRHPKSVKSKNDQPL